MRNIKLTIEYDGSRYQGWTRLGKDESGNTISNKITEVLKKMTEEDDLELFCGCRTEVGVHAYAQIANFKTSSSTTRGSFFIDRKDGEIRNIRGKQQMNEAQRAKVMQIIDKHARS